MKIPDFTILILLFLLYCYSIFKFRKSEFLKQNYYEQYKSMKGFVAAIIVIILLLVTIFDRLFTNS